MSEHRSALSVPEIERQLVAGVLVDTTKLARVQGVLALEDFEDAPCRAVWEALETLAALGDEPGTLDIVALATWLRTHHRGLCPDWKEWLAETLAMVSSGAHVNTNARSVAKAAAGRALLRELSSLRADLDATSPTNPEAMERLIDEAVVKLERLGQRARKAGLMATLGEATARASAPAEPTTEAIPTGLRDLDSALRGMFRRDVVTVGADTSSGKSTFAGQIMLNVARAGYRCLIFPLEMPPETVGRRMLSNMSGLPLFRTSELDTAQQACLEMATEEAARLPVVIAKTFDVTAKGIAALSREVKDTGGLDLLIVDYVQLASSPEHARLGRPSEMAAVSRSLKRLALDLNCVVMMLSQFNRDKRRDPKAPKLNDLAETSQIEKDSNVVLLLHREEDEKGVMFCNVAKNTNGPLRRTRFQWDPPLFRVRDLAKEESLFEPHKW